MGGQISNFQLWLAYNWYLQILDEDPIYDFVDQSKVHIGKKHSNIEQIDGHGEVEDNNRYENTEEYWREGRLGNANFTYVDAMHLIEHCDTSEDSKEKEKENVLEVRKAD